MFHARSCVRIQTVIDKRRVRIDFSNVDKPIVSLSRTRPRKKAPAKTTKETAATTAEEATS
jgi:hypothetical protein